MNNVYMKKIVSTFKAIGKFKIQFMSFSKES